MVGTMGMVADVFDDPLDTSDPNSVHHFRDLGFDAQYQYLLDPHTVTVQLAYMRDHHRVPGFLADQPVDDVNGNALSNTNATDNTNVFRAKGSYIWQAKYGASLAFFNQTGTRDSALYDPKGRRQYFGESRDTWLDIRSVLDAHCRTFVWVCNTPPTTNTTAPHTTTMDSGATRATTIRLFFYVWGAY